MKTKLKLLIKAGEVVALTKHLSYELGRHDMATLRQEPSDMLIMSALYELYSKVKDKAENIRVFGADRKKELYSITITRSQALALCCVRTDEPETKEAMQSYEANFWQYLIGQIHQNFLI